MSSFKARRAKLLDRLDGVLIVPAAPVAIRNNDTEHEYRQDSDLFYLTGFAEPESVAVINPKHPEHKFVLFVRPRDPEKEVWDGSRAGVEGAKTTFGADAAFPIEELATKLPGLLRGARRLHYRLGFQRDFDQRVLDAIASLRGRGRSVDAYPTEIVDAAELLHEMRLIKGEDELKLMREAADITGEAHLAAMALAKPEMFEFEVEAKLREVFRRRGAARVAYEPIVGSGPNATILHYRENNRRMGANDLLLIDAGCEFEFYACDVTRTFPVGGRFTPEQKELYEVVLASQRAAIGATKPGATVDGIHDIARRALVDGLKSLKFLEGSADEIIEKAAYKKYFMHRTSHWLGMDVHDVGAYYREGKARPLGPGMVITIEPGLYVSPMDEGVPEGFRGQGVRIEDDILVTENGYENLTKAIPTSVSDVEAACAAGAA